MTVAPSGGESPVRRRAVAPPRSGPTVLRMLLGAHLRRLREATGMTCEEAGYHIRASRSKMSRLEHGRVGVKDRDLADLLSLYGVTDEQERGRVFGLAAAGGVPGWWTMYSDLLPDWLEYYLGLEQGAAVIRSYDLQLVPSLLQTQEYARAAIVVRYPAAPGSEIERRVSLWRRRRDLIAAADPPTVWAVVDEAALRRPLGRPEVMRAQLQHLIRMNERADVVIQVMPFMHGGHPAAGGSFTYLRFTEPDLPDVVYLEQLTSAVYLGKREDTDRYLDIMDRLSAAAVPPASTAGFLEKIIQSS
jgi:hypothetical protein